MNTMFASKIFTLGILPLCFVACSSQKSAEPKVEYVYVAKDAEVPAGVEKQCWDEPKVTYEKLGPGVDSENHYYHPAYVAVREVKMGRWTKCEDKGDSR